MRFDCKIYEPNEEEGNERVANEQKKRSTSHVWSALAKVEWKFVRFYELSGELLR